MNYFALAGSLAFGLFGLNAVLEFIRVGFGAARWHDSLWGPVIKALEAAVSISAAVWLFNLGAA